MKRSRLTRVPTREGDWYVATSDKAWAKAIELSKQAARERHERMDAWEKEHHPGCYPGAAYWKAYNAEKYRIPIDWPMPEGHIIFNAKKGQEHGTFQV